MKEDDLVVLFLNNDFIVFFWNFFDIKKKKSQVNHEKIIIYNGKIVFTFGEKNVKIE